MELGPGTCSDGIDNDFDGRADRAADPGCDSTADPDERSSRECDDGVDNDLDGRADWRAGGSGDPDCTSLSDGSELPLPVGGCGLGPELLALVPLVAAVRRLRARRWAPAR